LNGALVSGKIVLCDGYASPKFVEFASGAAGVIFRTAFVSSIGPDVHALPSLYISESDGKSVYNYLKTTRYKTFHQHIYKILGN